MAKQKILVKPTAQAKRGVIVNPFASKADRRYLPQEGEVLNLEPSEVNYWRRLRRDGDVEFCDASKLEPPKPKRKPKAEGKEG